MELDKQQLNYLINILDNMITNKQRMIIPHEDITVDSISKDDLNLYIDSYNKNIVINYLDKNIKINPRKQIISELNALSFTNNGILKGISSDLTKDDETLALSTSAGKTMSEAINELFNKQIDVYSDISTLYGKVEAITDDISDLEDSVTTLEETTTEINDNITEINDELLNINNDITNINSSVITLEGETAEINNDIINMNNGLININGDITEINKDITDINNDINTINNELIDINKNIIKINSGVTTLEGQIAEINNDITNINDNIYKINAIIFNNNSLNIHSISYSHNVTLYKTGYIRIPMILDTTTKNYYFDGKIQIAGLKAWVKIIIIGGVIYYATHTDISTGGLDPENNEKYTFLSTTTYTPKANQLFIFSYKGTSGSTRSMFMFGVGNIPDFDFGEYQFDTTGTCSDSNIIADDSTYYYK